MRGPHRYITEPGQLDEIAIPAIFKPLPREGEPAFGARGSTAERVARLLRMVHELSCQAAAQVGDTADLERQIEDALRQFAGLPPVRCHTAP
jgi:hypothetical protein